MKAGGMAGLAILLLFWTGCGLLIDLDPPDSPRGGTDADPNAFLCQAEIFRNADVGLAEQWEAWVFPFDRTGDGNVDLTDGQITCNEKLGEYVARAQAPGFLWQTRNLTVIESTPSDPNPLLRKRPASECPEDPVGPPLSYGGPRGAVILRQPPGEEEASVAILATTEDGEVVAAPNVSRLLWRFGERQGFPDAVHGYERLQRNLRISDFFMELETPFSLGELEVQTLYIQSVGTVYAEQIVEDSAGYVVSEGMRAKFFFFGRGHVGDEGDLTSFCFVGRTVPVILNETQGPDPSFVFAVALDPDDFGQPLTVLIGLSPNQAMVHQPFLLLPDLETRNLVVDLGAAPEDTVLDNDGDLRQVLWFEDFETPDERFLGQGRTLLGQRFEPGRHEVTAIAYDSGVMENDTDAGVPRAAVLVSGPGHGILALGSDGGFTYTPDADFFGTDTFTYQVDHDGLALSNIAAVTITVVELTPQEEIGNVQEALPSLIEDGTLSEGQGNSLDSLLQEARDELDRGHLDSACRKLAGFISHVNGLVAAGILTEEQAAALIAPIQNVMSEEGCP